VALPSGAERGTPSGIAHSLPSAQVQICPGN
jgi:hypothetical protein